MAEVSAPFFRFVTEADRGRADVAGFKCGSDSWDLEVAEVLRSGEAIRIHKPPKQITFLYLTGDETSLIGFFNYARKTVRVSDQQLAGLHITWFAVAASFQGRGHGRTMMHAILSDARSSKIDLVDLYVYENNVRAIAMYEKFGFAVLPGADHVESGARYVKMVIVLD